jgi:arabinose-5-phosphate isomerase
MVSKNKIDVVAEAIRVLNLEGRALFDCAERLKQDSAAENFRKAIGYFQKALDQGGKIIVTGVGKSGKIGQKIAATLCSTGSLAVFLHPTEGLHGDIGLIRSNDAILALSYTGNSDELVRLIPSFKSVGTPVIGLGGNGGSRLASVSDVWLDAYVEAEACPYNLAPTTSTTLALAMGDAIAITLMQLRGFDSQSFASFHPGGSLGRRLNLNVEDIMHTGDAVPVVSPAATMEEVVIISTQKKLGAVLVVENHRLVGIITDGDLRRSLKHREKFFQLKAQEVMTVQPVTASPGMKAELALQLMEERASQISVLPVIDDQGYWKGLLRLHDLVRSF